jgi:L-ascorbate metabolism protein UlaG (beta-lactamase superfamily)
MYIFWYGQATFKLQKKDLTISLDPLSAKLAGLKFRNFKADITIFSNQIETNEIKEGFLINTPGEYEIKNVFVYGIENKDDKIVYQIEIDDLKIGYFGEISQFPSDEVLEKFPQLDVLILPVGNRKVLAADKAVELIRIFQPKIVIPSCFKIEGLKIQLDPIEIFLKEMGIKSYQPLDKIKISKKEFKDKTEVVILKPS